MATHSYGGAPRQGGYGNDRGSAPAASIKVDDIRFSPIPEELFGDIAKEKAKTIWEAGLKRDRSGKPHLEKNKATQLRKFYDEMLLWHEKVHHEPSADAKAAKYAELAPFIKMMKAKVVYAKGRDHVDENFEKLFTHLVDKIVDADSLYLAKLFMEAFMGFYKEHKQN